MAKPRKLNNGGGIGKVSGLVNGSGQTAKHDKFIIDDETWNDPRIRDLVMCPALDNEVKGHGLVPRKHSIYPAEMFAAPPSDIVIYSDDEIAQRAKELDKTKGTIRHLMDAQNIPPMDQGPNGYCWGHSTCYAAMAARCIAGMPYVALSAYSICATIKKGANEGGWCGLSAKMAREKGWMPQSIWPQLDRNYRKYDTPENWAEAAKYKSVGEFVDLTRNVYDQNLTHAMVRSLGVQGKPMAWDFNYWSHSVYGGDTVVVESGSLGGQMRNSWGLNWGDKGWAILRGNKWVTDGALCIYAVNS